MLEIVSFFINFINGVYPICNSSILDESLVSGDYGHPTKQELPCPLSPPCRLLCLFAVTPVRFQGLFPVIAQSFSDDLSYKQYKVFSLKYYLSSANVVVFYF